MRITLESADPAGKRTPALCGFVLAKTGRITGLDVADRGLARAVRDSVSETGGELGSISVINTLGRMPAGKLLLAGLGDKSGITNDTVRFVSGKIAQKARELGLDDFSVMVPDMCDAAAAASEIVEGSMLSLYSFDRYKGSKDPRAPDLTILAPKSQHTTRAVREAEKISRAAMFARDLSNMPPNDCSPATLAGLARRLCSKTKLSCRILGKAELKKRGFGGITAVGQGSANGPRLIEMQYRGARGKRPVVLVGKAVTFDTGGISLKPGEKMDEMKFDKCGGCAVLGIMMAVESLRLPVNVIGLVPSVENMPGGGAYRPGDIVTLYSKKTAEIMNTDAEGRLILADAISYAERRHSPGMIIDLATLTGACIVALGTNVAGLVSNNDGLAGGIADASCRTAEQVWRLPINDDYMDMIRSKVADMRNIGIGKAAGTITAAAFLRNAVERTPWAHLDIAGVAWTQASTKKKPYNPHGATGFGVRLIVDYLRRQ